MPPIKELLSRLKVDYPDITFVQGNDFRWSASKKELSFAGGKSAELYTLHELAHAILKHTDFTLDIELLRQVREAWDLAMTTLAPHYSVRVGHGTVEDALDTYRQWLHERSLCPNCRLTGLQTKTSIYVCINCRCSWRPNDARLVNLRRYRLA